MKYKISIFTTLFLVSNFSNAEWVKYYLPESPKENYFYENKRLIKNQKVIAVWEKNNLQYEGTADGMAYKSVLRRLLIDCSSYQYDVTSIEFHSEKDLSGSMRRRNFDGKNFTDIPINSPVEVLADIVCKK